MNILEDFYNPAVLSSEHSYSDSGIYHQIPPTYDLNVSPQRAPEGVLESHGTLMQMTVESRYSPALQNTFLMKIPSYSKEQSVTSRGGQLLWGEVNPASPIPSITQCSGTTCAGRDTL